MKRIYSSIGKCLFAVSSFMLLHFGSYAMLSGNYTINSTLGASSTNYQNWASAIGDLLTGSRTDGGLPQGAGVSGPVVFTVRDQVYTGTQITITAITGASAFNTITFKSTSDSSQCVLQYPSGTVATDDWVLQVNGAKWVTFSKIGFQRTGTNAYYTVVQLLGSASHNTISHCWFKSRKMASNTTLGFQTSVGSNVCFTGIADTNLFNQNFMLYGYNGFYSLSGTCSGNTISNNIIDTVGCSGIYMNYQNNFKIIGNTFNLGDFGASAAQYVCYAIRNELSPSVVISKNKIFVTTTSASTVRALVLNNAGTAAAPCMVSNNFVVVTGGTGSCCAFAFYGSSYLQLIYNNILVQNANNLATSTCIFNHPSYTNSFIEVRNNNLINKGAGYVIDAANMDLDTVNYNNCYGLGTNFGHWGTSYYSSFAAFNTASSKNANSINVDPGFVSNGNLHVSNIAINAKAIPNFRVIDDIDGEVRNVTTPDIGADEFFPIANDAGVLSVDSPQVFCAGYKNVKIKFQNYGYDTLKSVQINWKLNGITQTGYPWTGNLAPGGSSSLIQLSNYLFLANTAYTIKVWTSSPNLATDGNHNNDTVTITRYAGMSGTYTISNTTSANYSTFNLAVSALGARGICGPVTFNVTPGTYVEQFLVPTLPGMGAANPIIFQSTSTDSTLVVVSLPSANNTGLNNASVQLNAASYVTFKRITFQRTGSNSIGAVVHILNGTNHVSFISCQMIGIRYASISNTTYNIFADAGVNNYNEFRNNYVKLGSFSMLYPGTVAAHQTGTVIQGNIFDSSYNSAVQLQYNDKVIVKGNTFRNIRTAATGNFDLVLVDCDSAISVTGNYFNDSNTSVGIALTGGCTASLTNPGIIANNFINKPTGAGISIDGADYQNVVFNSIHLRNPVTTNVGIIATSSASTNIVLKNNNVLMEAGYVMSVTSASQISASNRNNFYAKGGQFAIWGGTSYSNLTNLKAASSQDLNSISVDPGFVSLSNLHVTNSALNGAAEPIAGVTTDIDGETRNATTPDIGADEFGGMIGTYTINPKIAAASRNYTNWASAINDLLLGSRTDGGPAQGQGIKGPVTFTVYDTLYANTQIQLTAVTGSSAVNTITFKSTSDSSKCKLQYASGTGTTDDYVLMLNGAKHIIFKKIGFERTGTNTNSTVVQILGSASNNIITNCWMKAVRRPSNTTNSFAYGIGSCVFFTGIADSTTISQNFMLYGYNGVYGATASTGIKILNNIIDTAGSTGVFMGSQTNLIVSGNSINMGDFGVGSNQYTCYAIRVESSPGVIISKNKCILLAMNAQVARAIILYNTVSTAAQPALINNNFVINSAGYGNCTGLNVYGAAYSQWFYNNVLITNPLAGGSAFFHNASFSGSPVEVGNNNLINKGGTLVFDANGANYTDLDTVNYNNGFTTGATYGNWNGTPITSFTNWKTATAKEANSVNVDPGYTSNFNLHVSNMAINGKGRFYYRVRDDIDGETRNLTIPDIGADEITFPNEAGISSIPAPLNNSCPGTYAVKAVLKNFGEDTLKHVTITWSINNVAKTPVNWTGNLAPLKSDTVTVGMFAFAGNTNATVMVRTSLPNGKVDPITSNDSFKVVKQIRALPVANAGTDLSVCNGDSVLVGPVATTGYSYRWLNVAHNVVATTSQFYFKQSSPITLFYEVTNKTYLCVNTDTLNISVNAKPIPNAGTDQAVCKGVSAMIGSASQTGYSYDWTSLPVGYTSILANPMVLPSGTTVYIVKQKNDLTSCFAYDTVKVSVDLLPTPKIIGDTAVCEGKNLPFYTASVAGSSYLWKVTTGSILSGQGTDNVNTKWPTSGIGTVEVIETNAAKCKDSTLVNINISLNPKAKMSSTIVCSGSQSSFIDSSANVANRLWDFGDGQTSTSDNVKHAYVSAGTFFVKLKVFNSQGCVDSITQQVNIKAAPKANFTITSQACIGASISITNSSTDADNYLWNFGDTRTSTLQNPPSYSYSSATTYNVKLVVDGAGCKDSTTKAVTVNPFPVVNLGADDTIFNAESKLLNAGTGFDKYLWSDSSKTNSLTVDSATFGLGVKTIWVKVTQNGCDGFDTVQIVIIKTTSIVEPKASFELKVYPNPTSSQLNIELSSIGKEMLITLTDVNGKQMKSIRIMPNNLPSIHQIDVSELAKGVYYLNISNSVTNKVSKIVIN